MKRIMAGLYEYKGYTILHHTGARERRASNPATAWRVKLGGVLGDTVYSTHSKSSATEWIDQQEAL